MGKVKKTRAVMVRLLMKGESLAISLDDVEQGVGDGRVWQRREHFTHKVLEEKIFEPTAFEDKELADFGYFIMARLSAFQELGEAP